MSEQACASVLLPFVIIGCPSNQSLVASLCLGGSCELASSAFKYGAFAITGSGIATAFNLKMNTLSLCLLIVVPAFCQVLYIEPFIN